MSLLSKLHLGGTCSILQDRYHQSSAVSEAVNHAAQRAKESKRLAEGPIGYIKLDEKTKQVFELEWDESDPHGSKALLSGATEGR